MRRRRGRSEELSKGQIAEESESMAWMYEGRKEWKQSITLGSPSLTSMLIIFGRTGTVNPILHLGGVGG